MPPIIRLATEADLTAINTIYNHFVLTCTCTYQEVPETLESRQKWLVAHGSTHPAVVVELDGRVAGWGSISPFHARSAFRFTVEDSVYIAPDAQGRGLGRLVLQDLIDRATQIGHRQMVALIDSFQPGSLELHRRFGFVEKGRLDDVGLKFNRALTMVYLQRSLT